MIKKAIYFISIISISFLTFLVLEMMPLIFESNWQGKFFLFTIILFIIVELYLVIKEKSLVKKSWSYNIFLILATMYVSLIYYKIYSITPQTSSIYEINITYCKNNYLILGIIFIFIIINIFVIKSVNKEEKSL